MITAYVKPTNYCSVGCEHCYLTTEVRADRRQMSEETLRAMSTMLSQMAAAGRHQDIHILWHGGEPLMMPVEWFERAGELLDDWLPGHLESLQTSLIPFSQKWVPWVQKRLGSHIGTSMDFSSRTIKGSAEDYQRLWMQKVDLARANQIHVVPGVVPTTKEIDWADGMVQWFVDRDLLEFNIDRYNAFGIPLPNWPNNAQHSRFLIGLFDSVVRRWGNGDTRVPIIRVVLAAIGGVLFQQPGDRWGGSCQSDFVVIEPDGSLNNCPDKASYEKPYANATDGFAGFSQSAGRRKWIRIQALDHRRDHCAVCDYRGWCKSGCPLTPNGPKDGQAECAGYKRYLNHIRAFCDVPAQREIVLDYYRSSARRMSASISPYEGGGACQAAA